MKRLIALVMFVATSSAAIPAQSAPGAIPVPAHGAYLGAWVKTEQIKPSPEDLVSMTAQLEAAMRQGGANRGLALHLHFYSTRTITGIGSDPSVADDFAKGRTPVLTWTCGGSMQRIAAGDMDGDIIPVARAIGALHGRVMLRWFHEFNLNLDGGHANGQANACFTPGDDDGNAQAFIAAWRHIHQVFAAQGATNVTWLWCPAATPGNLAKHDVMKFFPGTQYVDWIGGDFYDRRSIGFVKVATPFYEKMHAAFPTIPLMIAETGEEANSGPPFTQARYLEDIAASLPTTFPQIKAVIYFDAPGLAPNDYRLTGEGLAAFAKLAANPYFAVMP